MQPNHEIESQTLHFNYQFELVRNGVVIDAWEEKNLIPTEGLNHILDVTCKGGTQVPTWYVAPYEGDYTPIATNTAANFPGLSTECTAYNEATRVAWVEGTVAAGAVDNSASKAEFTFNASKTIYGCSLVSVSTKSATTGVLLSAVRFGTSRAVISTDVLRVTAPVSLTSA